ncbi:hypothetical protein LTR70_004884 [Exophiala xenobiotica]|uniref:Prolactin receptor n=1 Tax=Lithohypha guttulata TaxID=1690604 RepID=A0ABR0KCC5_9EURO|nr:hypothetical protein LTR24_004502 [Lithohypha guttulata]KAK5319839.1 hypothetical protein LTR70_004884 [Exophiala xenobiotica]
MNPQFDKQMIGRECHAQAEHDGRPAQFQTKKAKAARVAASSNTRKRNVDPVVTSSHHGPKKKTQPKLMGDLRKPAQLETLSTRPNGHQNWPLASPLLQTQTKSCEYSDKAFPSCEPASETVLYTMPWWHLPEVLNGTRFQLPINWNSKDVAFSPLWSSIDS